jgi:hypothetical protein
MQRTVGDAPSQIVSIECLLLGNILKQNTIILLPVLIQKYKLIDRNLKPENILLKFSSLISDMSLLNKFSEKKGLYYLISGLEEMRILMMRLLCSRIFYGINSKHFLYHIGDKKKRPLRSSGNQAYENS